MSEIERDCQYSSETPAQKSIARILNSVCPIEELKRQSQNVPHFLAFKEASGLKKAMEDPFKRNEAFSQLIWFCLPQISAIVNKARGLGIRDKELVEKTFLIASKIIDDWHPKRGKPTPKDHLRFQVATKGRRQLVEEVVHHYGLGLTYFPTIQVYFQARRIFYQECGREAEKEDSRAIVAIAKEICQKLGKPPRLDRREEDVIAQIDDIYTDSHLGEVDLLENPCEKKCFATALKEKMNEVLATLPPEESEVLWRRFGFSAEIEKTQEEIAAELGVSRQTVYQRESRALKKLRHPTENKRLRGFLVD